MTITIMPPGSDLFASSCEALVNPVDTTPISGAELLEEVRRFAELNPDAFDWLDHMIEDE